MRGALARKRTRKLRGIEQKQNLAAAAIQGAFRSFARRRALNQKRENRHRAQQEAEEAARRMLAEAHHLNNLYLLTTLPVGRRFEWPPCDKAQRV